MNEIERQIDFQRELGMTPEQFSKLPAYARNALMKLHRDRLNAESAARAAKLDTKPEESDTVLDTVVHGLMGLGEGPSIGFMLDGPGESLHRGHSLSVQIKRTHQYGIGAGRQPLNPYLEVRSGGGRLRFEADQSNSIKIYVVTPLDEINES
jgi:hypothetical protein